MFERYTERARRAVFFARYEAGQYGSANIEAEHLLLGILRENYSLADRLLPKLPSTEQIRRQIEKHITVRKPILTSVEVPLSKDCKRALHLASDEATQCGSKDVGCEHLLLGLVQIREGLIAEILQTSEPTIAKLREKVRKLTPQQVLSSVSKLPKPMLERSPDERAVFADFMARLRAGDWLEIGDFFARNALFLDADGAPFRGRGQIVANQETLLLPFSKRNAKFHLEEESGVPHHFWLGVVLWDGIHLKLRPWPEYLRTTLAFGNEDGNWQILLFQVVVVAKYQAGRSAGS